MKIISNLIEAHIFRESEKGIEFLLLKRSDGSILSRFMANGNWKNKTW